MRIFTLKEKSEEEIKNHWENLQRKSEEGFRRNEQWKQSLSEKELHEYNLLKLISVPLILIFLFLGFKYAYIGLAIAGIISVTWFLIFRKKIFRLSILPVICFGFVLIFKLLFIGNDLFMKKLSQNLNQRIESNIQVNTFNTVQKEKMEE